MTESNTSLPLRWYPGRSKVLMTFLAVYQAGKYKTFKDVPAKMENTEKGFKPIFSDNIWESMKDNGQVPQQIIISDAQPLPDDEQ